jgi:hypothetical protein
VNLILDTGCRNLVLFGKRFEKNFSLHPTRLVKFSGLGQGKPIEGRLALDNKVSIDAVLGERIPIVVMSDRNLFSGYPNIHGVIGYEVFCRFEIELNPLTRRITFRPGTLSELPSNYTRIDLRIEDSRPILNGVVNFSSGESHVINLMIDTGSTLGLLVKMESTTIDERQVALGRGLNGILKGIKRQTESLRLENVEVIVSEANVIFNSWNNYSSIGMDVLKDYSLILNYSKAYAGLKPVK